MSSILVFENTAIKEAGKTGVMTPDADGFYDVVLGAFGVHNSSGAYYPDDKIKNLFTSSSELMNRIKNGRLYGEWGHPKHEPGMTGRDYLIKLLIMHEEQISHFIKRVELVENFKGHNGRVGLGVMGSVKPHGPCGSYLQQSFDTPEMNCCFSLRSISIDSRDSSGRVLKNPVKIVTWDAVGEPGIDEADKYHNPATESRKYEFTDTDVAMALERAHIPGASIESATPALESLATAVGIRDLNKPVGNRNVIADKARSENWLKWGR